MNDLDAASGAAEQPAPVSTETPEVVTPEVTEGTDREVDPTDATAEKSPEQRELERLRRQLTKRDRTQGKLHQELQAERAAREALERRTRTDDDDGERQQIDPQDIERLVSERAKNVAKVERLNEKANQIYEQGAKKFNDFDAAIKAVNEEAPLFDKSGPTPLMEAVFESDQPAALLHYLGKNPDIAGDLADLTPTQIARRLVRIETEMQEAAKPKQSSAPRPLAPIKSATTASSPDPSKDVEAWIKWRNQQTS